VIDNNPAPSRLVNADALGEELKFYPRRPRPKSVRPGQARHFATHTQGLFRVIRVADEPWRIVGHVRRPPKPDVAATNESFVDPGRWRAAKAASKSRPFTLQSRSQ
jgi:hypothetical protein